MGAPSGPVRGNKVEVSKKVGNDKTRREASVSQPASPASLGYGVGEEERHDACAIDCQRVRISPPPRNLLSSAPPQKKRKNHQRTFQTRNPLLCHTNAQRVALPRAPADERAHLQVLASVPAGEGLRDVDLCCWSDLC
jgi:hypothetical protein